MAESGYRSSPPVEPPMMGDDVNPPPIAAPLAEILRRIARYGTGDPATESTGSAVLDLVGKIPRHVGSGIRQVAHGDLASGDPEQVTRAMFNLSGGSPGLGATGLRGATDAATKAGARLIPDVPGAKFEPFGQGTPWMKGQTPTIESALKYLSSFTHPMARDVADRLKRAHGDLDVPVFISKATTEKGHNIGRGGGVTTSVRHWPEELDSSMLPGTINMTPKYVQLHPEQSLESATRLLGHEGFHISQQDPATAFSKKEFGNLVTDAFNTASPLEKQIVMKYYERPERPEELVARHIEKLLWQHRLYEDPAFQAEIARTLGPSLPRAAERTSPPPRVTTYQDLIDRDVPPLNWKPPGRPKKPR